MSTRLANDPSLAGLKVSLTIHRATGLIAKDRNLFGKKTSSDPYVKVYYNGSVVGKTKTIKKCLDPEWEQKIKHVMGINDSERLRHAVPPGRGGDSRVNRRPGSNQVLPSMQLVLLDYDKGMNDDALGQVNVPIELDGMDERWFPISTGSPDGKHYCKKAKGEICVSMSVTTLLLPDIVTGNTVPLKMAKGNSLLKVGLGWKTPQRQSPVDLDVSCVAIGTNGKVLMNECVYFANLHNPNRSISHSGDEREGRGGVASGSDGSDDQEQILVDLDRLPSTVAAYVLLVTVATPGVDFSQVTSTRVRIVDGTTGIGFCAFRPAYEGECTALFCLRIFRKMTKGKFAKGWNLATIGATDRTARDFGSLIPEIKGYCRDLFPGMNIDPNERVAIMNKEVTIRVKDYTPERDVLPPVLAMGLAWDVTNGVDIDLDASAVCLDSRLNLVDMVYFKNLHSADRAIHHSGDEREGDEIGDDEKIIVALNAVNPRVEHIVFVINSYSEQELDDVAMASCHLFDPAKRVDLCTYTMTNNAALDGHTAVLLADLYRDASTRDWMMRILSVPSQGKTARRCIGHIADYLKSVPPHDAAIPPNPDVVMTQMPVAVPVEGEILFEPVEAEIVLDGK